MRKKFVLLLIAALMLPAVVFRSGAQTPVKRVNPPPQEDREEQISLIR